MPIEITELQEVNKGWSGDKKYCAVANDGQKYLLRISSPERTNARMMEYEYMKKAESLDIPMCRVVEITSSEHEVRTLYEWIEGSEAQEVMTQYPPRRQYEYGVQAGEYLGRMHSIPAPHGIPMWEERFGRKIDRKLKMYAECSIKYPDDGCLIEYIEQNRSLISSRPQSFQHGDYHIGNMMIDKSGRLVIIDFDKLDFGDPWEEFNRIVWCAQESSFFASGMVDGYFGGSVPQEFWRLLALYIASNTLSSLPWSIPFGDDEVQVMMKQYAEVMRWYDNMNNIVPTWYRDPLAGKEICEVL